MAEKDLFYQKHMSPFSDEVKKEQIYRIKPGKPLWIKSHSMISLARAQEEFLAEKLGSKIVGLKAFRSLEEVSVKKGESVWTMHINATFSTFAVNATKVKAKS
jgi:hypothetical protein